MPPRRRISADERRRQLVDAGARQFATQPYDAVRMEEVAAAGGVSRALLYRHFPTKRDLFAAVYTDAAGRLLEQTTLDPALPIVDQVVVGLEAHFDYFLANRQAVLTANRTLAGDPVIAAIIDGELDTLRERMLDASGLDRAQRAKLSSIVLGWLMFVRVLSVEWLTHDHLTRDEMIGICVGALAGALDGVVDLAAPPAAAPARTVEP